MGETETLRQRDQWSGRTAFILAAIGSAVGLGNLWGFPYKVYEHGGAAFLIPYVIALVVLGVPLLILEYALGHWAQNSAPGAFGRILGRYRFVGWWLTVLAFVIITYYVVVLAIGNVYLWESLASLFGGEPASWSGGAEAAETHFKAVTQAEDGFGLGLPSWPVLIGTAVGWLMIYLCLFRGVKWVSKVVLVTVPLPWLMLLILAVRGLTLEGAETGLHFYLEPTWGKLLEAATWRYAFGQVFFSLSLGFAVMLSYASFLHRKSDLANNAAVIGLGDLATSFVAGIVVFSTLGNLALQTDQPVEKVVEDGAGLAFITFPHALAQLPAGASVFALVFFVALLTLGIDSAFSIVETVQAAVNDNKSPRWRARWTLPAVCGVGFVLSILFTCRGGGLNWLTWADNLINGPFGIPTVALAECLVVGWAWRGRFLRVARDHVNERSDWRVGPIWMTIVRWIAPGLLLVLVAWILSDFVAGHPILAKDAEAKAIAAFPGKVTSWRLQAAGHLLFALLPLVFVLFLRGRSDADRREDERHAGRTWPLLVLPYAAGAVGVGTGAWRFLLREAPVSQTPQDEPFQALSLGITSYVMLTVIALLIVGGLATCFWLALRAAGRGDVDYAAGDSPADHEG